MRFKRYQSVESATTNEYTVYVAQSMCLVVLLTVLFVPARSLTAASHPLARSPAPHQSEDSSLNSQSEAESEAEAEAEAEAESEAEAETQVSDKVSEKSSSAIAKANSVDNDAIATARASARELNRAYGEAKQLAEIGSVSRSELRRANFAYKMALLDVVELETPAIGDEINLARAKLEFELTSKELAMITVLYQRGSASELAFQQAASANEIAELGLKAVERGEGEKYYRIKIARNQVALAKEIQKKADRLVESGSISKKVYQDVRQARQDAEDELETAKKQLGIQVRQIPVSGGEN